MIFNFKKYTILAIAGMISMAVILAILGCGGITMKNYNTAEEQYYKAHQEYQKKHYLKAIDGFQKVVYNYSGSSMVDSAQFFLAMSYYNQKDFYLAAAEFERLVLNYPGSPFVDDGQYMSGLCYYKSAPGNHGLDQEEMVQAIGALTDFVTDYPESDLADDARGTIRLAEEKLAKKRYENGRTYYRLGHYDASAVYFQLVIDEHTSTEWAARSFFLMAEIEYKKENFQTAKEKYNNFLIVYSEHEYVEKARKRLLGIEKDLAEIQAETK